MKGLKERLLHNIDERDTDDQSGKSKVDSEGFRSPRWFGYVFMLLYVLCVCFQQLISKQLFNRNPLITPTHLLLLNALFSSILFALIMNVKITHYMYHAIEQKHYQNLLTRVVGSILVLVCLFTALKYLPLVIVSLVSNLTPLFIAILSYFFLKKGITVLETGVLIVSFGGVCVLITGTAYDQQNSIAIQNGQNILIPLIALLLVPTLSSVLAINLRQMRELSEYTVSSYTSFSMLLTYGLSVYFFTDYGYTFISQFQTLDWLMSICIGSFSAVLQICCMKAVQYEEPAKVAVVRYFQIVFQLIFDIIFFNTVFSTQQIVGMTIVFGATSIKWIHGIYSTFFKAATQKADNVPQKA